MKKVLNYEGVAHAWMHQTQDEARTTGNRMFFEGDAIFSYGRHFVIAKHVTNATGEKAILFTKDGYSNTTAKHKSIVERASFGNILQVPELDNYTINHDSTFLKWISEAERVVKSLETARKPEIYISKLGNISHEVWEYAMFFNLTVPERLKAVLNIASKDEYLKYSNKRAEFEKQENERAIKENKKSFVRALKKFRAFESDVIRVTYGDLTYLRYNKSSQNVETSQAVNIPLSAAKKFFERITKKRDEGGCTNCKISILHYEAMEINKTFIVVGCHKIEWKEINKIAKQLNWI